MNRRRKRRRSRSRYNVNYNHDVKKNVLTVLIVVSLSVAAGYLTATKLLGPALGLESQPTFFEFIKEKQKLTNEKKDTKEQKKETNNDKEVIEDGITDDGKEGFALQYGSFSNRAGAEECTDELKEKGISTEIVEKDGMYKVIGDLFGTKAEAEIYRDTNPQDQEVFITQIE